MTAVEKNLTRLHRIFSIREGERVDSDRPETKRLSEREKNIPAKDESYLGVVSSTKGT